MTQWIKIEDELPDEEVEVLTCGKYGISTAQIAWFTDDGEPYFMCKNEFPVKPIYWMPLPEVPEDLDDEMD